MLSDQERQQILIHESNVFLERQLLEAVRDNPIYGVMELGAVAESQTSGAPLTIDTIREAFQRMCGAVPSNLQRGEVRVRPTHPIHVATFNVREQLKRDAASNKHGVAYAYVDNRARRGLSMGVVKPYGEIPNWDTEAMQRGEKWEYRINGRMRELEARAMLRESYHAIYRSVIA
jgi:hypothetical protein